MPVKINLARSRTTPMAQRHRFSLPTLGVFFLAAAPFLRAQDDPGNIRVNVDLVQLNVAVTDAKGNYVSGLGPENFAIMEDKINERLATFEEGNEPTRQVLQSGASAGKAAPALGPTSPAA